MTAFGLAGWDHPALAVDTIDPFELSPEELLNATVTSVSRTSEKLSEAPAAIYVISRDDILRSGATSIPEMLRLAPNLQVARGIGYAISARGFDDITANKLLVLVDGRSVYTPLYSGVFWDSVNVLPEDIERIEVISGPGATLWGANAVNGVINIITRNSRDTQGVVATITGGNTESGISARFGGRIDPNTTFRLYAMDFNHGNTVTPSGADLNDSWVMPQGGFRLDWNKAGDLVTVQGDMFDGTANNDVKSKGHNLLGRWNHDFGGGSALQVQTYYDYTSRAQLDSLADSVSVFDLDIQHSFSLGERHSIVWGGGYRITADRFTNSPTSNVFISPTSRTLDLGNVFIQDTVSLTDNLKLIGGIKAETNSFTSTAVMPNLRMSWQISETNLLWAAVSRAVRTPARFDRDVFQTSGAITVIGGGPDFQDENLTAYELGYRTELFSRATLSVSTYYNVYTDLRSLELARTGTFPITFAGVSGFLPGTFQNMMEGNVYGVEIWGAYSVTDWWRLNAGFNALHEDLRFKPGSLDVMGLAAHGDDPDGQFSLRSSMNLGENWMLDVGVRGVGALPDPKVPAYVELDARLGWNVSKNFEVSIAGFNLLDASHPEFGALPGQGEIRRNFTVSTRWTF
jgi:iron complex outermembrane receptor protein